jgi:hypothetical protein
MTLRVAVVNAGLPPNSLHAPLGAKVVEEMRTLRDIRTGQTQLKNTISTLRFREAMFASLH